MMALLGVFSGPDGMKGQIGKLLKTSQDCQLTLQCHSNQSKMKISESCLKKLSKAFPALKN